MPNYDQANILFSKLVNDEPILLSANNTGQGAVVATPSPTPTTKTTATPSPTPSETLDWAIGTNAATTTCSN
jgi:hypothetical protein